MCCFRRDASSESATRRSGADILAACKASQADHSNVLEPVPPDLGDTELTNPPSNTLGASPQAPPAPQHSPGAPLSASPPQPATPATPNAPPPHPTTIEARCPHRHPLRLRAHARPLASTRRCCPSFLVRDSASAIVARPHYPPASSLARH
ncbi:hypothetical protein BV25DRAFT_1191746 [Artomyces pyxidatus]|uniref:Uncharacterized protein n=1 Tax=Artomyces pyxidatus TaxID=48021 RepID=A0ACB8SQC9_9AGAM|nr:hypothetical protein BV25DRAFT_1191746 [Artomyces pyxidatus]